MDDLTREEMEAAVEWLESEQAVRVFYPSSAQDPEEDKLVATALTMARERLEMEPTSSTLCRECGPRVAINEDGKCVHCGSTAAVIPWDIADE